jgi:hypothetical protein
MRKLRLDRAAIVGSIFCAFFTAAMYSAAETPSTAPNRPATTKPQETTTSWNKLYDAYRKLDQLDSGTITIVARDGIAARIDGQRSPTKKYRVDARTKILVAKPAPPRPGTVVHNATTIRLVYGTLADVREGARARIAWDQGEHAAFIEAISFRGDIVIVESDPLDPTPLPAPTTRPTTRRAS